MTNEPRGSAIPSASALSTPAAFQSALPSASRACGESREKLSRGRSRVALALLATWLLASCGGRTMNDRDPRKLGGETITYGNEGADGGSPQGVPSSSLASTSMTPVPPATISTSRPTTSGVATAPPTAATQPQGTGSVTSSGMLPLPTGGTATVPVPTTSVSVSASATMPLPTTMPTTSAMPTVDPPYWVPIDDPAPNLTECQAHDRDEGFGCSYDVSCTQGSFNVTCVQNGDEWGCTCYGDAGDWWQYSVTGGEALSACAGSVALCSAANQPPVVEENCDSLRYDLYGDQCLASRDCSQVLALPNGLEGRRVLNEASSCTDDGNGNQVCNCNSYQQSQSVVVVGSQLNRACLDALDGCEPSDGPVECAPRSDTADASTCSHNLVCGSRTDLNESGTPYVISATEVQWSSCSQSDYGWACSCSAGAVSHFAMFLDGSLDAETACTQSDAACGGAEFVPGGQLTCTPAYEQLTQDTCYLSSSCMQPGTLNQIPVNVDAPLDTDCAKDTQGNFLCGCWSGLESYQFTPSTPADGFDICRSAQAECAALAVWRENSDFGYGPSFTFQAAQ